MLTGFRGVLARLGGLVLLAGAGLVVAAAPAPAGALQQITVNIDTDPAPGACEQPPTGDCSLREAFIQADAVAGPDDITVDPAITTITLDNGPVQRFDSDALTINGSVVTIQQSSLNSSVIENSGNQPLLINDASITGGNGASGAAGGVNSQGTVVLEDATVEGNTTTAGLAGGVYVGQGGLFLTDSVLRDNHATDSGGNLVGGGAFALANTDLTRSRVEDNTGTSTAGGVVTGGVSSGDAITLTESTVRNNTATTDSNGATGGVFAFGDIALERSTVAGNTASTGTADSVGGVAAPALTVTAVNSTVESNTATGGTALQAGGIGATTVELTYSTVVDNNSPATENVVASTSGSGSLTSFGSVVARPQGGGANCTVGSSGTTTTGYNHEAGANTCGFGGGTGDVPNGAAPMLGALANNGGPTPTRLPQFGSPLVDKIPSGSCNPGSITTDQRNVTRPVDGSCDIGSVEGSAAGPPPATSPPVCPANAALVPGVPTGAPMVLLLGAAPFALLRLVRRKRMPGRLNGRIATVAVVVGGALVVLAACAPIKAPPC